MWNISEALDDKCRLIGVLSSRYSKDELDLFIDYIKNHFSSDGDLVYICSKDVMERCKRYLKEDLEPELREITDVNRLIFICRDNYKKDDYIDTDGILESIKSNIDKLREIYGDKIIYVYITVDSYWNSIEPEKGKFIYNQFKSIIQKGNIKFILRYISEEIEEKHINYILSSYDFLFVDGVDSFDAYNPNKLIRESLISLCESKAIEFKYHRVMMRSEYLENLGEAIGGVVHDINNLLVSILGHAQYLMELDDLDEIQESANVICKLALDGKSITDKIRNEIKGSSNSSKEIYKFDYIINNCIDMVKNKFRTSVLGKSNNLELSVDLNSKKYIYANEYDLRHSIINLILNGIDAMGDYGVLSIRTYDKDDNIVLEISDTGCGIDESSIDKIFKPYYTTKDSRGTGLGLSIAKKVFEDHDGKLYVESKVGEGTKFTIYFPCVEFVEEVAEKEEYSYN